MLLANNNREYIDEQGDQQVLYSKCELYIHLPLGGFGFTHVHVMHGYPYPWKLVFAHTQKQRVLPNK
jgi:hypothetical protein